MNIVRSADEMRGTLDYIASLPKPVILGFTGVPPDDIMREAVKLSDTIIDLDMPRDNVPLAKAEDVVPSICCATLRTITANTLLLKSLDWIVFSSGIDKCDGGRFIAEMLKKSLDIPVVMTENLNMEKAGNPICESDLPLLEKFNRIVNGVVVPDTRPVNKCKPQFGFWGVPPNDFSILELFPPQTHVFGWARCMENRTPADVSLEEYVNPDIPTIFFAQAFCPKNILAYSLARRYNGLYVEVDNRVDRSIKAKIEAFLWLSHNNRYPR
ncbi:MAG: hypothetical protein AB1454_14680 [Candidatus Auribacterota bacterium]